MHNGVWSESLDLWFVSCICVAIIWHYMNQVNTSSENDIFGMLTSILVYHFTWNGSYTWTTKVSCTTWICEIWEKVDWCIFIEDFYFFYCRLQVKDNVSHIQSTICKNMLPKGQSLACLNDTLRILHWKLLKQSCGIGLAKLRPVIFLKIHINIYIVNHSLTIWQSSNLEYKIQYVNHKYKIPH